jgi:multiple sugar transport system substrate-binding protein
MERRSKGRGRRWWLAGLIVAAMAGCAPTPAEKPGDPVRLVYWPPPNRYDLEMTRVLIDDWNRRHPEIQVEVQPLPAGRSSEEVLLASIVGKTTPDLCSNILTGTVERMMRAGALVPLSRFPDFDSYLHQRSPAEAVEPLRSSDGRFYQLPWKANPGMLIVNSRLLAEAGVRPPRTYSEFLSAAARLTRDSDGDGRVDHWAIGLVMDNNWFKRFDDVYPLYVAASGGQTLVKGRRVLFDGPPMVGVFTFLRAIFDRGYAPRSYYAGDLFLQGRVAMWPGSGPNIPDLESKKPSGFQYDFIPVPVPDDHSGAHYTFGDLKSMVMFSGCKHPEAAWQVMKHLTSPRADLMLITQASQLPLRRGLLEEEPFAGALRRLPLMAKLAHHVDRVRGTDDAVPLVEILDTISQAYESGALHRVIPPDEAVHRAARRVKRILEQWD